MLTCDRVSNVSVSVCVLNITYRTMTPVLLHLLDVSLYNRSVQGFTMLCYAEFCV